MREFKDLKIAVTSNCENNSIYAGVPAKLIRRID